MLGKYRGVSQQVSWLGTEGALQGSEAEQSVLWGEQDAFIEKLWLRKHMERVIQVEAVVSQGSGGMVWGPAHGLLYVVKCWGEGWVLSRPWASETRLCPVALGATESLRQGALQSVQCVSRWALAAMWRRGWGI